MWGVTGIIYNPEDVTKQEASTWKIINNDKFRRMITAVSYTHLQCLYVLWLSYCK